MIASCLSAPRQSGHLLPGVVLVLFAVGCGPRSSLPKTYPVTGKVIDRGGQALPAGTSILFAPVADSSFSVSGDLGSDGKFSLFTVKGKDRGSGAPEGEYRVTIQLPIPPDQRRGATSIDLPRTFKVEPKDNDFPIEVDLPRKP